VEIAPTDAVQALKQAALLMFPSGQQGQGFESAAAGIMSAQCIPEVANAGAPLIADTIGADISS
jgi:hypothetical protein